MSASIKFLRRKLDLANLFKGRGKSGKENAVQHNLLLRSIGAHKRIKNPEVVKKSEDLSKKLFTPLKDGESEEHDEQHATATIDKLNALRTLLGRTSQIAIQKAEVETKKITDGFQYLSLDNSLVYVDIFHMSQRITMKLLTSYLAEENMKDFHFIWEEFEKAVAIQSEIDEDLLYPVLNKASGNAVSAAYLLNDQDTERKAALAVQAEIKEKKQAVISSTVFENWKRAAITYLEKKEKLLQSVESKIGATVEDRRKVLAKSVISPTFVRNRAEFLWTLNWCVMVLSAYEEIPSTKIIGILLSSLQILSSPTQYTMIRDKIKNNMSKVTWMHLVKEYKVDQDGNQPEPEFQKPPVKDHPKYGSYFKMLKIGLPKEAVAKKMALSEVVPTYDEALRVLSLDPNNPLPDVVEAIQLQAALQKSSSDAPLAFHHITHECFTITIENLSKFLDTKNLKDFGFIWEELQKAISIHAEIEDALIFPALDKVSGNAMSSAALATDHVTEKTAASVIDTELKQKKLPSSAGFQAWKILSLAHLDKEDKLVQLYESKFGNSSEARYEAVFTSIMCPIFVQYKTELAWLLGWCAMVLGDFTDGGPQLLGHLVHCLQAVSSPSQYFLLRDKMKNNLSSSQWSKLNKEYAADEPGKQTGQVAVQELPIKEEPRFARYFKMLKVGLPLEAAAVKMSSDQAVDSYEEAVAVLSLDPSKPMPDKYKD